MRVLSGRNKATYYRLYQWALGAKGMQCVRVDDGGTREQGSESPKLVCF